MLNRAKGRESLLSQEIRSLMGCYGWNLWQAARVLEIPSYLLVSVILGESDLDGENLERFRRLQLEAALDAVTNEESY